MITSKAPLKRIGLFALLYCLFHSSYSPASCLPFVNTALSCSFSPKKLSIMFAKTSSAVKRKTPGTVTSSFNLERSLGTQKKLMYNDGAIGIIPQEVREEFWKTLSDSSYAKEFSSMNIKLMKKGKAPYSPITEHCGNHNKYILHPKQPINKSGDVYNLDNLIIVSPKIHQTILDPSYHFWKKGL